MVQVQDSIVQLHKFESLPADVEKSIEKAQALVKDSESSRQVYTHPYRPTAVLIGHIMSLLSCVCLSIHFSCMGSLTREE